MLKIKQSKPRWAGLLRGFPHFKNPLFVEQMFLPQLGVRSLIIGWRLKHLTPWFSISRSRDWICNFLGWLSSRGIRWSVLISSRDSCIINRWLGINRGRDRSSKKWGIINNTGVICIGTGKLVRRGKQAFNGGLFRLALENVYSGRDNIDRSSGVSTGLGDLLLFLWGFRHLEVLFFMYLHGSGRWDRGICVCRWDSFLYIPDGVFLWPSSKWSE